MINGATSLYYQWQAPGKAVAVSLSVAVVEQIGSAVREEGEPSSPRRSEIGGFLLGSIRRIRGSTVVEVDGFEMVECEHAFGASYFLSGSDQRRLAERIRRHKPAGGSSIVGFFRSNTRKEFALTVEDIDLMSGYFSKPSMVLLLVHITPDGALRGGFSIWEQRAIRTTKSYLEFPFDAHALLSGSFETSRRPSEAAAPSGMEVSLRSNSPANRQLQSLLAVAAGCLRWPAKLETVPAVRTREIFSHFSALLPRRFRGDWLIAAAALTIAILGAIVDRGPRPVAVPAPVTIQAERSDIAAVPVTELPVVVAPPPVLSVPQLPERPHRRARVASRTAVIRFTAPVLEAAAAPPLPSPPNVPVGLPESPEPPAYASGILPSGLAKVPDPFVSIAVDTLPNRHRGLLGTLRLHGESHRGATFVPPRVLQEHSPEIPSELRSRIRNTVPITVKLYLDRTGSVHYAELLSDGTGPNRDLATLAVFASRKWRFSPAQQGGEAVPAEVLVRFRFGAGTTR